MSDLVQSLTTEQRVAACAEGNLLVVAGAGTGKTSTLVARCLAHLLRPEDPVPFEAILMVTFTEAAAAEMRQRLRAALEQQLIARPHDPRLAEQLAGVDTARISTLHGFCLRLVRDHFYQLAWDPELSVLPAEQAGMLAQSVLDTLLGRHLQDSSERGERVRGLCLSYAQGRDSLVRALILRIHQYTQTLADPHGWFEWQRAHYRAETPQSWVDWLLEGFNEWRGLWLPELEQQPAENTNAAACVSALRQCPASPSRTEIETVVAALQQADQDWGRRKQRHRHSLKKFFDEVEFFGSLTIPADGGDPLAEDWEWVRGPMLTLLELAVDFAEQFSTAKREMAAVDFHDLEQGALRLLWDFSAGAPTDLARQWRSQLRLILVDEVQDLNRAQDRILTALAGEGSAADRFLVGDVKQSIYRFRLADPSIFQEYSRAWSVPGAPGRVLNLSGNFRSCPAILDFVNRLFSSLMRSGLGDLNYTADQWLRPGSADRGNSGGDGSVTDQASVPVVEFHCLVHDRRNEDAEDASVAEREARLVARRLSALRSASHPIRDRETGAFRPVAWGDVAVLLRAPRSRVETYARVFAAFDIPLAVERDGFYDRLEVSDLLSLLKLIDNPRQDLPLLAVLRSPLVGLAPDELVYLRTARRSTPLWSALHACLRQEDQGGAETRRKLQEFLNSFQRWRHFSRQAALSETLELILDESAYEAWLAIQPGGDLALGNLRQFLALIRQFDPLQRQGLHRFLRYVESQVEAERPPESVAQAQPDAVRLLSIHQSKGLEFPVVVLADLGKRFNLEDLRQRVILDEHYGLCPAVQAPRAAPSYPSLPHWLAGRRQRRESLGEELRLLYVACTRARDFLILCGAASRKAVDERWPSSGPQPSDLNLLSACTALDWIGPWQIHHSGSLCKSTHYEPSDPLLAPPDNTPALAAAASTAAAPEELLGAETAARLRVRLEFRYPFLAATQEMAKASVSYLRKQVSHSADEESRMLFIAPATSDPPVPAGSASRRQTGDAAVRGSAHHLVLESIPLQSPLTQGLLLDTVQSLRAAGALDADEADELDLDAILAFWNGPLGKLIMEQHDAVHRELPFTARFSALDLAAVGVPLASDPPDSEFIIVQGVVDLAVVRPDSIWLVDFKTDRFEPHELTLRTEHHRPQLALYALALERIYGRPVTRRALHFLGLRVTVSL